MTDFEAGARAPDTPTSTGGAGQAASQAADAASGAAANVAGTAKEQGRQVGGEVRVQARTVAAEVKDKVTEQAHTQHGRLVDGIRQMADDLDRMSAERGDSPAASVVSRIASGGRQAADYLSDRGPEGVLDEVQEFARRRPGAFLLTALATGFVVGRLGKGVITAGQSGSGGGTKPPDDAFVSNVPRLEPEPSYPTGYPSSAAEPGYTTGAAEPRYATGTAEPGYTAGTAGPGYPTSSTEYAATGTGTPVALPDDEPGLGYEGRP